MKDLILKIKMMSHNKKIMLQLAIVLLFGIVVIGISCGNQNKQKNLSGIEVDTEEDMQVVQEETEVLVMAEAETEFSEELETETEIVEDVEEIRTMSFSGSSIQKDLKIKFFDDVSGRMTGVPFEITVVREGDSSQKTYIDEDMDGIIHITNIEGGNYTVTLKEIERYIIRKNPITVTVKETIAYEKVEIKDEVQAGTGSQAVTEDKSGSTGGTVAVQKPETNKTEPLKSTVTTDKISASEVDKTKFTKASVSNDKNHCVVKQTLKSDGNTQKEVSGSLEEQNPSDSLPVIISADVKLPKQMTLYYQGEESSKTSALNLEVNNANGIITDWNWKVDNTEVVSFSLTDKSKTCATFTGLKEGTANVTITISYMADGNGTIQTDTISSTIIVSKFTDNSTKLLDKNANTLYLDEKAKTVATLKDYGTTEFFYGNIKYTGWQTIDGRIYYYDANHNKLTGQHTIDGVRYDFKEDGSMVTKSMGIDVSKWQGKIDWKAVAKAGVEFAIIRVGYRGAQNGVIYEDPYFKQNIAGATAAGIKVGVYFFSQAITEAEAIEEASMAISYVSGYNLAFPIYIDTEQVSGGRANSLSRRARTNIVKAFCKTVQNAGRKPGVYAGTYWLRDNLYSSELESYSIWVARYNDTLNYSGKYDMWQYTDSGKINGIKNYVDMNICYRAY